MATSKNPPKLETKKQLTYESRWAPKLTCQYTTQIEQHEELEYLRHAWADTALEHDMGGTSIFYKE